MPTPRDRCFAWIRGMIGPWTRVDTRQVARQITGYLRHHAARFKLTPTDRNAVERSLRRHYLRP